MAIDRYRNLKPRTFFMRLLIYNAAVLRGNWSGVEWAVWNTAAELAGSTPESEFVFLVPKGVKLPSEDLSPSVLRLPRFAGTRLGRIFYELFAMPRLVRSIMKKHGVSREETLFIAPAYVAPPALPCPYHLSLYDLHVYTHARFCSPLNIVHYRARIPFSIQHAEKIIVPSENTYQALISLFPAAKAKTEIRPLGINPVFKNKVKCVKIDEIKAKYGLPASYFLFVGDQTPRKNLPAAIAAWQSLRRDRPRGGTDPETGFVIVGEKPEKQVKYPVGVICTGYVEENDLPMFYAGAKALVYPSFDEGYGLPIAEAAACGCPVITTVKSAQTICPDAILCGTDAASIALSMKKVQ